MENLAGAYCMTWFDNPFRSSGSLPLVAGFTHSFNRAVLAVVLWEYCLVFPYVKGDPKLLEGLLRACKQCTGKSSP